MSEVVIDETVNIIEIRCYGGTRRERGAALAAAVRKLRRAGKLGRRISISYSETYGFQSLTKARYWTPQAQP